MQIVIATVVLGGLSLLFGVVLTVTSRVFAIPSDPKRDAIREALPGANCGACGYPGCDGLADAIAAGKAAADACPVGGTACAAAVSEILGIQTDTKAVKMVAKVICQGDRDTCKAKYTYDGIKDCIAATTIMDGPKACKYACLGLGTCVRACPFDAIHIDERRQIAVVDEEKCKSCAKCVAVCPKNVLSMQPNNLPVMLLCRAAEEGKIVSDNCRAGCIGCELCAKECKFGAITMVNHLPKIDQDKCVGCMMCAEVCPTSAIQGDFDNRLIAQIEKSECIGCGICKKVCQFEAVAGENKQPHMITEACTGCGQCAPKCPKKCISMNVRRHVRDENAKVGTTLVEAAVPAYQAQA